MMESAYFLFSLLGFLVFVLFTLITVSMLCGYVAKRWRERKRRIEREAEEKRLAEDLARDEEKNEPIAVRIEAQCPACKACMMIEADIVREESPTPYPFVDFGKLKNCGDANCETPSAYENKLKCDEWWRNN